MPFNDFFKRLLGLKKNLPTCHATGRTAKFVAAYQEWLRSQAHISWANAFFMAYHYKKADLPAKHKVQLLQEENLRGVIFFYDPSIGAADFSFFFEFLKDRVQQQGYTLYSRNTLQARQKEEIEKIILTPPASDLPGTSLCNQLYGNVLLDFIKIDKNPGFIRFATNSFQDALFSKALPFEELLEKTLRPDEQPIK